jgi:hypothetical protein
MNHGLAQRILDLIYRDSEVRRTHKDTLSDWILDTHSRSGTLNSTDLLTYLSIHQPDLLEHLKINVSIGDEVSRALEGSTPH